MTVYVEEFGGDALTMLTADTPKFGAFALSKEQCKGLALFSPSAYKRIRRAMARIKSGESAAFCSDEGTSPQAELIVGLPIGYTSERTWPLLVWLHDESEGPSQVKSVFAAMGAEGVVVVAPRGQRITGNIHDNPAWNLSDEGLRLAEERIFDAVAEAQRRTNIDVSQVYLAGSGSGGSVSLAIGCACPDRFAGLASIDGVVPELALLQQLDSVRDVRLLFLRSKSEDQNLDESDSRLLRLAHAAGLKLEYRLYGSFGESRLSMFRDLKLWLINNEART